MTNRRTKLPRWGSALLLSSMTAACATSQLRVEPPAVQPGGILRITSNRPDFDEQSQPIIRIGKMPAKIVKRISAQEVDVLVPVTAEGDTSVDVSWGDKQFRGLGKISLLPASAMELLLSMDENGKVTVLSSRPSASAPDSSPGFGSKVLSYDLINAQGGLVLTGVVMVPEGQEVFDQQEQGALLHRQTKAKTTVFTVKVPNIRENFSVQLFEAPADFEMDSEDMRKARKPITELKMKGARQ